MVTFEELNLNKPLLKALADLEYISPTPIQVQAFPMIMAGRNVIGIAQTGTGKTFAYLLPLLRQLTFSDQKDPRVLIIAPTRELTIQILNEVRKLTAYSNLRSTAIYGGTNINTQKQTIYNGVDIVVATPGRLIDLAFTGVLRLKFVQKLVIDEVDALLDLGFRPQLLSLLNILPEKRQNLMFSATLNASIETLLSETIPNAAKIEIVPHGTPIAKIAQKAYSVANFNTKVNLLELLVKDAETYSRVLVFTDTKKQADRLFERLEKAMPEEVGVIHSNKSHNNRINTLRLFETGSYRVLIATDIVARGMDITDVSHVVNFDMPQVPGDYIHRIGRTGRADKDGAAISFVNPTEHAYLKDIESFMAVSVQMEKLPKDLIISKHLTEEEIISTAPSRKVTKSAPLKATKGAFHEKKEKNKKVNLGGPKQRKAKFDKTGKPIPQKKATRTRF